jgi:hypothetical protein
VANNDDLSRSEQLLGNDERAEGARVEDAAGVADVVCGETSAVSKRRKNETYEHRLPEDQ